MNISIYRKADLEVDPLEIRTIFFLAYFNFKSILISLQHTHYPTETAKNFHRQPVIIMSRLKNVINSSIVFTSEALIRRVINTTRYCFSLIITGIIIYIFICRTSFFKKEKKIIYKLYIKINQNRCKDDIVIQ